MRDAATEPLSAERNEAPLPCKNPKESIVGGGFLVTRRMLASFISQAVEFGMKPTIFKLFNMNIDAKDGEQIFKSLVQCDVRSIKEMDFNKNPLMWSHQNAEMVADLIMRQSKLEKLMLMTEQIPFYQAKTIKKAAA